MARRILMVLTVAFFGATVMYSAAVSKKGDGDFRFSHKLHIDDVGAECEDCHAGAATAAESDANLLPSADVCADCHDADEVSGFGYTGQPAPARELIYSHERHISTVGLVCLDCHKGIERTESPAASHLPDMDGCVDCHNEREMSDDCRVCHSQVEMRRPEDHVADWVLDHVEVARSDEESCANCHQQNYCQECHDGAALGLAVIDEEGGPVEHVGPLATAHTSASVLILQRAHDLNYRYTHGTDVSTKTSDCATCHETTTFCVACHNPDDDASRLRPVWHDLPNFGLGGDPIHAEMARNDIESCAACHDATAAEPRCMQCHDRGGVAPHPEGFMEDVEGYWHDDDDAVCFVCHDPGPRLAGQGFCGRCHDSTQDD